jgi:geranylgeranyl pyrophosphate synthase
MNPKVDEVFKLFEANWTKMIGARYPETHLIGAPMHYACSVGGKRVRPILCMLVADSIGHAPSRALAPAMAVELIHTYSLIHDDLPCMDDDDMRRGKPSTHKAFDEPTALLAGDGLLTDAFSLIAESEGSHSQIANMVGELAAAAGSQGMVLGQALDLHWTNRPGPKKEDLDDIHLRKTGYLIGAACAMGAIAGGGTPQQIDDYRQFGRGLGLAFQIRDDLIDDLETTGKTRGKDASAKKLTYLSLMNFEEATKFAKTYTEEAFERISGYGHTNTALVEFGTLLLKREK